MVTSIVLFLCSPFLDLLNPNNFTPKDQQRNTPVINKSPLSGSHHLTPLGNNIGNFPLFLYLIYQGGGLTNTPPAYHNLPQGQNIFYNPMMRTQEPVPPSPMIQTPFRFLRSDSLPTTQVMQLQAPESNLNKSLTDISNPNDVSSSLHSILYQLQNQFPSQPKNLDELLQRSFSSMPSNSVFQNSFTSAMQSPFIGNTQSSHYQFSAGSEFSKGLNSGLLGTPLQNNHLFNGKQINPPQSNEALQSLLISQLADLLKQESEHKIKSAIAELLMKYKHLGFLTDKIIGKEMAHLEDMVNHNNTPQQQVMQQYRQQNILSQQLPQHQLGLQQNHYPANQQRLIQQLGQTNIQGYKEIPQQTISLQGVYMNALPRDDGKGNGNGLLEKNHIPSNKVEAARKGIFGLEPIPERRNLLSSIPEEPMRMNNSQSLFQSNLQLGNPSLANIARLDQQFGHLGISNGKYYSLVHQLNFFIRSCSRF